mgnify:CR=1 FL=1
MKRLFAIPCITAVIFGSLMTSCEKELPLGEALIGRWEVLSYKYIIYENNVKKSEVTMFLEPDEMELQFAEGGAGLMYEGGLLAGNFSYTLSGSTLTVQFGDGSYQWDVTIEDDTLVWSYEETETEENKIYKYEFFYTAKRVS